MARFLPDAGLLIQHVPRTGGTFVEEALDRLGINCNRWTSKQDRHLCPKKHSLLSHYHRDQMAKVESVACFVRHPVAYYRSVWRYLRQSYLSGPRRIRHMAGERWRWHPFRQAARLYRNDFERWAELILEEEPGWATRLMAWYVGPESGEFCDFIGRTETVAEDLSALLSRFRIYVRPEDLDGIGTSNASEVFCPEVPRELAERICREERVLIRRFYAPDTLEKRWFRWPPRGAEQNRPRQAV